MNTLPAIQIFGVRKTIEIKSKWQDLGGYSPQLKIMSYEAHVYS